ncbi:MAG: signal recognition particle-docking protein FtsY [Proteobacteria bacterium]|nr:signal recognition particle-docking protein FtsY [Pseudomonadota bacterium]
MFFNKKKKEENRKYKQSVKEAAEKEKELSVKIEAEEQSIKGQSEILGKGILTDIGQDQKSVYDKFRKGLTKTKKMFIGSLTQLSAEEHINDDFFEDLEDRLLAADLGYPTTSKIIELIEKKVDDYEIETQIQAINEVKKTITSILDQSNNQLPVSTEGPSVYLFVGVNGVGKTTSIGKLAAKYKIEGKKVLIAAGDTFRAAAIEQLETWAKRADVDIISNSINSDPSATMYQAAEKAVAEKYDILLCDTAGRLQTKKNLMEELEKMQRVIKKVIPDAPHASLLALDANTGQNAIIQTKEFSELIGLDGLIVTKLDGTAKGGVIIGIVNEFEIPVYFIGIGEGIDDLQPFSPRLFSESLFDSE